MLVKRILILFGVMVAVMLTGCDRNDIPGIFNGTSPHANERFTASMEWNAAHGYATLRVDDEYKIYVATDSHIEEGKDANLKRFVLAYKADKDCPFAIHLGDMINIRNVHSLFEQDLAIEPEGYVKGSDTIFTVAGNHDLFFNQWGEFLKYRHTSTFYVETLSKTSGKRLDFYIFIDSGSGTLGTEQTEWLRQMLEERSQMGYRHIIICTHTHFFEFDMSQGTTSCYALEETTTLTSMFSKYNVSLVLTGHDHLFEETVYGNVRYLTLDALKDDASNAAYLVLEVGAGLNYSENRLN